MPIPKKRKFPRTEIPGNNLLLLTNNNYLRRIFPTIAVRINTAITVIATAATIEDSDQDTTS